MESLRARCTVATGILIAIPVISAAAALSDMTLVRYLQGLSSGQPVDEVTAGAIDSRQAVIGLLQSALTLACAIVFLMWFYRAHKNLRRGGLGQLEYASGWAVGGFFVPFLNLVRPFQVMKEVWTGSAHLSRPGEEGSRAAEPVALVGWWWAFFLVTSVLGSLSGRLMLGADELEELTTAGWTTLAADLADIPAAIAALLLVRRVTDFQEQARARRLQTEWE